MDSLLQKFGLHFLFKTDKKRSVQDIKSILQKQLNGSKDPNVETDTQSTLTFNVSQYRSPESFNEETKRILNMVTMGKDILPVGSLKYGIHRYPGDIDMYEKIKTCCTLEEAGKNIKKKIQTIAKQLYKESHIFMADFKAGTDERYYISDMGHYDVHETLHDYNPDIIKEQCIELKKQNLFTHKDFVTCFDLIKDTPTKEEWDSLYDFLRTFYVIRWNLYDLKLGFKILNEKTPNEIKVKLEDAIKSKSICKLDIWAPINGRYIEITNFLVFIYVDNDGDEHIINIDIEDYIISLIKDLKKYGKGYRQNSLKYAKRLWAIASTLEETHKLNALVPLFSSGAAILYQISAEIEVLIQIFEEIYFRPARREKHLIKIKRALSTSEKKQKKYDSLFDKSGHVLETISIMITQIDNFKQRIGLVYENFTESEIVFKFINNIIKFYRSNKKKYLNDRDKQIIIDNLIDIKTIIDKYVEEYTTNYLKKVELDDVHQYDSVL